MRKLILLVMVIRHYLLYEKTHLLDITFHLAFREESTISHYRGKLISANR